MAVNTIKPAISSAPALDPTTKRSRWKRLALFTQSLA
jgi:hypothetical protein